MYKKLSMILLIIWTVSVVLILTFGTEVAAIISKNVSNVIHSEVNKLQDVIIEETKIPYGQNYTLKASVSPDTFSKSNIIYSSLDENLFEITDTNKVLVKEFDGDEITGKLLITNALDPNFKKEVELTFYKTYPTNIQVYLCDESNVIKNDENVYLNVPFRISTILTPHHTLISEKNLEIVYDEELFTCYYDDYLNAKLVPKYLDYGVNDIFNPITTTIKVLVNNKEIKSYNIVINPSVEVSEFDSVKVHKLGTNDNVVYVKDRINLGLYLDNMKLITDFNISTQDTDYAHINADGTIECLKSGTVTFTVTLPNGFTKDYSIVIRNKLGIPKIGGLPVNENNEIIIKQEVYDCIYFNYDEDISYTEFSYTIDDGITHQYTELKNGISLYSNKVGNYNLVVTIDDGIEEPIILKYVIKVVENNRSLSTILSQFSRFLAKVLGHMSFFVVEAILAFFMMYYYKGKNKILNLIIYIFIGLFLASLTEFIQLFIPGRSCQFKDVLIDMGGYCIGFIISLIAYSIIKKRKNKNCKVD